jgi:hypothetical protein
VADNRASEYRRLGLNCLQVAQTVSTEEGRLALIEMARVWTRLADEQDAAAAPMPEGSQPVMQQQEQEQPQKDDKE